MTEWLFWLELFPIIYLGVVSILTLLLVIYVIVRESF